MYSSFIFLGLFAGTFAFSAIPIEEKYYESSENDQRYRKSKECKTEEFIDRLTITDLKELLIAIARRQNIPVYTLLKSLSRRIDAKLHESIAFHNSLDDLSIQELSGRSPQLLPISSNVFPSSESIFPFPNHTPDGRRRSNLPDDPVFTVVAVPKPKVSAHPTLVIPGPPHHQIPFMFPPPLPKTSSPNIVPLLMPIQTLRPPAGATVRINASDKSIKVPDVIVTVSPMMSVFEALRQADIEFQRVLGLSPDDDVISFHHSPLVGCFVVSRFDSVPMQEDLMWKITILDKEGKVLYDGVCVPRDSEIIIKPGMVISLTYTEF